jgi:hypothetical protein
VVGSSPSTTAEMASHDHLSLLISIYNLMQPPSQ